MDINKDSIDRFKRSNFGKYSLLTGILLTTLGLIGIFLPSLISLEANFLIASLLLIGGLFWLIHSFQARSQDWSEWLKPLVLFITGGLMAFYPMTGIATIGLLMAVYLLFDAYGSFIMSYGLETKKESFWMIFNGALSLLLAFLFLFSWPESSLFLVGIYIAISLIFDGLALMSIYWIQKKS